MELISRAEARERGLTHYFTGKACANGHVDVRYVRDCICKACGRIYRTRKYHKDPARQVAKVLQWRNENRQKHNKTRSEGRRRRFASDPRFALELRIRNAINDALRKQGFTKAAKAAEILGCTWTEFAAHLERQFLPGMTWANRDLWHIDHIVPLATAVTEGDVLALNHFTNLRPLWKVDNLKKGAKQTHLI